MFTDRPASQSIFCAFLFLGCVSFFCGCTPAGPRAVLKGEQLLGQGRVEEAVKRLEEAVGLLPEEARAWNLLGVAYHRAGRLDEAEGAYRGALERDRDLAVARYNLGNLLLERGDAARAALELATFTGLQVNSFEGWLKLGEAQLQTGQPAEAERSFVRAYKIDTNSAAALNGMGLSLVQRQRYTEAWKYFSGAVHRDPVYAAAWFNAGVLAQTHLRQTNLAIQAFERYLALTNAPKRLEVEGLLAGLRPLTNRVEAALSTNEVELAAGDGSEEAEVVSEVGVGDREAVAQPGLGLGGRTGEVARVEGGKPEVRTEEQPVVERVETNRVAEVKESEKPVVVEREVASVEPKPPVVKPAPRPQPKAEPPPVVKPVEKPVEKPEPVRPPASVDIPAFLAAYDGPRYPYYAYRQAKEGNRPEAIRLLNLGINDQRGLRTRAALESYRKAVELDPSLFETHYNQGVASFELGILDEAMRAYERALSVNPDSVPGRFNFAMTLQKSGYVLDAAAQLHYLAEVHPEETRVHMALGNLYADVFRDYVRAKAAYLKVLELEPEHPNGTSLRFWIEAH
jgi:tetratricopeptide (TPR) repeat protein